MKAEQNGTIVNLKAENRDEQRLLDAYWERGVRVCTGGSRLGISLPGSTYILELTNEQIMGLMYLLGSGRDQTTLTLHYQSILEEVIRSIRRSDGDATMAFLSRAVQRAPELRPTEPGIIARDRAKVESHTSVVVSIHPDTSGDYVITEENSDVVLGAVGEYLLATKKPEEESP